jgi:predicted ester cyclase
VGERPGQDYPDLEVTVEQVIAEGDMVASYQRYTGTQQGDVEDERGVPATGLATEWVSMGLFRIECGKIAEVWAVADDLGRLQRLGVITDEELQSVEPVATPSA